MRTHTPAAFEESRQVRVVARNVAFERLAGFVAIRQTQKEDEVLRQLLLHLITLPSAASLTTAPEFVAELGQLFGLKIAEARVQSALDSLVGRGDLIRSRGTGLALSATARVIVLRRIEESQALEMRVREAWTTRLQVVHPTVDSAAAWRALEAYLARAFRQHGAQTLSLIDPALEVPEEYQVGLRAMLAQSIEAEFEPSLREAGRECIVEFLLHAGRDADRTAFIARLADCTVSFLSLTVPPEIAERLKGRLKPLTVFLDTNVLFGLVGLDDQPVVEVSRELVDLVREHRLPIKLRYHSATEHELRRTFETVTAKLKGSVWSTGVSRVAARSPRVSTIQRLNHERNARLPITAETFFKPFEHMDVLIKEHGIEIYRDPAHVDQQPIYDLVVDYKETLERAFRIKPYEAHEHDMILLDCVRRLRSKASSSLEAGALVVTSDFLLWKFDRSQSRRTGALPTIILVPQLLQLLRPFVSESADFDRSFAESFAVPEFRALGDGGQAVTARMLEIVASYENISEDTVEALLANDLFLDGLTTKREDEIYEYVESAIAAQNARLGAERDVAMQQLDDERSRRQQIIERARLEAEAVADERVAQAAAQADAARSTAQQLNASAERAEELRVAAVMAEMAAQARLEVESRARAAAEELARGAESRVIALEVADRTRAERNRLLAAVVAALLSFALTEAAIRRFEFQWLLGHPSSYALRGALLLLMIAIAIAALRRDLRKAALVAAVIPFLGIGVSLLGGPRPNLEPAAPPASVLTPKATSAPPNPEEPTKLAVPKSN